MTYEVSQKKNHVWKEGRLVHHILVVFMNAPHLFYMNT